MDNTSLPVKFSQRAISWLIISTLVWQPMAPAVAAAISPTGPASMDSAANGVPVLNIATPNGAGISHNQFKDYNVGKEGLILNNATGQLNQTQLGGIIQNNPRLRAGQEAKGIINEVTGGSRSKLQGYTEVAGKAANVIVANSYGITCDGCGFINTPNATLTTGKPQFDDKGNLSALNVTGGTITVEGKGLDASNSGALSLISRATEVNAAIHATDLKVIVGANRVGADGSVTAVEGEGPAPTVAVDTGALGGMYANRIHLVSSDKGVGVNLGNLSARQGDIQLDASGKLVLKDSLASGNTAITATEVTLSGDNKAGDSLSVVGENVRMLAQSRLVADNNLTLSSDGQIILSNGELTAGQNIMLSAQHLSQTSGTVNAAGNITLTTTDDATLEGSAVAGKSLAVTSGSLNNSGVLSAGTDASISSGVFNNTGTVQGNSLKLAATDLTSTGSLKSASSLDINARNATLAGVTSAGGAITVKGSSLKTMTTAQMQGNNISVDVQNAQLDGTQAARDSLTLNASGSLTHDGKTSATTLNISSQTLTLSNSGHVFATGNAELRGSLLDNSGTLQGEDLLLNYHTLTSNGTVLGATSLTVKGDTLTHTDEGRLYSSGNLLLDVREFSGGGQVVALGDATLNLINALTNNGMLAAGNRLSVTSQGAISNNSVMQGNAIVLNAGGDFVNNARLIAGDGNSIFSAQSHVLNASGSLQAGGDVSLTGLGDITVHGFTGTAGSLTMNAAGTLLNTALIYAGSNLKLFADKIHNLYGDMLAGDSLWMLRDTAGTANTEILNISGSIETLEGDIAARTQRLENKWEQMEVEILPERSISSLPWLTETEALIPAGWLPNEEYGWFVTEFRGAGSSDAPGFKPDSYATPYDAYKRKEFAILEYEVRVTASGGAARIASGRDLVLEASALENQASHILAQRDASLTGSVLNNQSWESGTKTIWQMYEFDGSRIQGAYGEMKDNPSTAGNIHSDMRYVATSERRTEYSANATAYRAVISAGGDVTADFTGDISNTAITANADGISNTIQAPSLNALKPPSVGGGLSEEQLNNGYFIPSTSPDSPYLITVNPNLDGLGNVDSGLFDGLYGLLGMQPGQSPRETDSRWTDEKQFLGSSYFMERLGLTPERDYRFLGDAAFDTRYVSNAILNQTGSRYINGLGSDVDQMQYLMDSAAGQQQHLGLQFGVSLSAEQVASLTGSILWWESATINGQTVMVPRLYLSPKDITVNNGSVISGSNVQLAAGDITNSAGSITAQNGLTLDGGNSISNLNTGLISAGESLNLSAIGDINNTGSAISGKSVALESTTGSINNITRTQQWEANGVGRYGRVDVSGTYIGSAATITASDSLSLDAGSDINLTGANVSAGGSLAIMAGNNINIAANNISESDSRRSGNNREISNSISTHTGSSISAGSDLVMVADNNLNVTASSVSAGDTARLSAGNDLNLNAARESEAHRHDKSESHADRAAASTVTAGDDLTLTAGRDLNSQAAGVASENNLVIQVGRDINLMAEAANAGNSYKSGNKKEINDSVRQQGSELISGGNTILSAGRDITAEGASAIASGDIALNAGRDITLTTATESDYHYKEEKKKSGGFLSKKTTHTIQEDSSTRETGTLLSGNNVSVEAGKNILVSGSQVVGDEEVALKAGDNIDILAATNTNSSWRFSETKKSGLMGSGGIGFTIGSSKTTHDLKEKGTTQSQSFSTVGSTGGNVVIAAGNLAHIGGADLIAGKDMSLSGSSVLIDPGHDKRTRDETFEQKKSGLTLALSGTVGSAINNAVSAAQDTKEESDGRLKALQATKTVLSGVQAGQAADMANTTADPNAMGVSLSLTTQKSKSQQHAQSDTVAGSTLNAGNNLSITANGKKDSGDIVIAGSQLKAGGDTLLDAKNDVILSGAASTQQSSGKNSSSGGGIGVSIGAGQGAGISVFANVNAAKGKDKGNGTDWTETTIDSGKTVTLKSGNDTVLNGALVNGDKIIADVGHDLLMSSQQDSNKYDSKQSSVAAGGSFTFGSMTGSGYISASQDKMKSRFDSVAEQTGLYAGQGGFDITVGNHTQLDGAVIASTATADKNSLDTGTLGFSDIHNEADFKTQHTGISISGAGSFGDQFKGNMPGGMIAVAGNSGHAEGTTQAAVGDGTITIRDKDNQKQDVANLSRDTEHANDSISPIFDKEKEQNRLKEIGMIGDIGGQVADIARTQGELNALKAAQDKYGPLPTNATEEQRQDYLATLRDTPEYKREQEKYGTGSDIQRGIQAATAALQGLAGGNLAGALAGASAPELAHLLKSTEDNPAVNTIAHAILGGAVAALQGNSAAAGAIGAGGGELAARAIASMLYPGVDKLSEEQKQTVSSLASISAGMAGGIVTGNSAGAATGASAGKNAVENNYLSSTQALTFDKELSDCRSSGGDCQAVIDKWKKVSDEQSAIVDQRLEDDPLTVVGWDKEVAQGGYDMTERPGWLGSIGADTMTSEEAKAYVQQWNGQDLAKIDTNSPEWMKYAVLVSDPENQAMLVSAGLLVKDVAQAAISFMSRNTATATVKASEIGMQWGEGNMKQGMPWEDYVGTQLPANSRLPQNFKTFDYYDVSTKTAVSAKSMDTQTMAKLANPNQIYSSIKGNIDTAVKFEKASLSGREINASMITNREIQLAVPANTTKTQWTEINRAIEYGKSQGITVKVTQVK